MRVSVLHLSYALIIALRAAERYLDLTPEERSRRRARGWGDSVRRQCKLVVLRS